ncbi:MAG: phage protease [Calditrichia bacterium]
MTKKENNQVPNKFANLIWLFSEMNFSEVKAGDKTDIQIMRVGKWNHGIYGTVRMQESDLTEFAKNFDDNVRRIKIAVDENHDYNHKAVGWFTAVTKVGKALFATIEWNAKGAELISGKEYRYFSPELSTLYKDDETGKTYKNVLTGGGITNRPFFKAMKPLMASEEGASDNPFYSLTFSQHMKTLLQMLAAVAENDGKATDADKATILKKFNELGKDDQTPELKTALTEVGIKFDEAGEVKPEDKTPEELEAEKKVAEEKKAEEEKIEAEKKSAEAKAEEVKKEEEKKIEAPAEKIEASEKTVTIKESDLKALQKGFSDVARQLKTQAAEKEVGSLVFSESSKAGMLLPKDKNAVVEFAASLSNEQAEKFYEVLGTINKGLSGTVHAFSELGKDAPGDTASYADEESFLQKKMGMSPEDAKIAAKEYNESKKG